MLDILSNWVDEMPRFLNWILKRIYKEENIKERIKVDLTSNKSANRVQLLDNGNINFILRITNLTPFELIVDDITLEFSWEHITKKICKNNFEKIKKNSEENVFLYESLSSEESLKIATAEEKKTSEPRLRYTIDFSNRLYRFQKYGDLNSFGLEILNLHTALEKLRKIS